MEAGRGVAAAGVNWGRGLGNRGAAALKGLAGRTEGKGVVEEPRGLAGRAEEKGAVDGPRGVAGRTAGNSEVEAPRGLTERTEGKDDAAGNGAGVVAAPAPKAGTAEPGPREEGPASRPKPEAAIGAADSRSQKP